MSRADWHDPDFRAAWQEVTALTPVLDQPEADRPHPLREVILGWLVFLVLVLLPFVPYVLL